MLAWIVLAVVGIVGLVLVLNDVEAVGAALLAGAAVGAAVVLVTQHIDDERSDDDTRLENARYVRGAADVLVFDGLDLEGQSLRGLVRPSVSFAQANLKAVDFSDSNLDGGTFALADVSGANFQNASLKNANFSSSLPIIGGSGRAAGRDSDKRTIAIRADLSGVNVDDADFSYADLRDVSFYAGSANDAVFVNSDLRGADFGIADFRGADFTGADLRGVSFFGTDIRGANLAGALLNDPSTDDPESFAAMCWDEQTAWPDGFTPPQMGIASCQY